MLSNLNADSDFFTCTICKDEFNHTTRTPRIIPVCGHTFCSECIMRLINPQNQLKCPLDQIVCTLQKKSIEFFPTNILLKQLVEHRASIKADLCENHESELKNLVCMTDQKRICKYCVDYGDHANHDVRYIKDVQMLAEKRRKKLEGALGELNIENRSRENLFKAENESLVNIIKGRFVRLRVELDKQEQEVLKRVGYYLKELKEKSDYLHSSRTILKAKEKLDEKISALKQAKFDKLFFEALKETAEIKPISNDGLDMIKDDLNYLKASLAEELDEMNTQVVGKLKKYSDIDFSLPLLEESNVKCEEESESGNTYEITEHEGFDSSSSGAESQSEDTEEEEKESMNRRQATISKYFQQQQQQHSNFEYCGFIQNGQDLRRFMANQRTISQPNHLQISGFRPISSRSKRSFEELPTWSFSQGNDGGDHEVITKRLFLRQGGAGNEDMFENRTADFSQYFNSRVNFNNLFSNEN